MSRSRSTGSAAFDIVDSTVLEWCAVQRTPSTGASAAGLAVLTTVSATSKRLQLNMTKTLVRQQHLTPYGRINTVVNNNNNNNKRTFLEPYGAVVGVVQATGDASRDSLHV